MSKLAAVGASVTKRGINVFYNPDFNREYRSVIFVPNQQRVLRVKKVDEKGRALAGAVFAVFDDDKKAHDFSGSIENLDQSQLNANGIVGWGKTDENGYLVFQELPGESTDHVGVVQTHWPPEVDLTG